MILFKTKFSIWSYLESPRPKQGSRPIIFSFKRLAGPGVNKIFLFVLLVGIVLVIFYLFKFIEFLSKINENCKEKVNLKLNIDQIKNNLKLSVSIVAGIVGVLFILIVGPTVMTQTGRNRKK